MGQDYSKVKAILDRQRGFKRRSAVAKNSKILVDALVSQTNTMRECRALLWDIENAEKAKRKWYKPWTW